MAIQNPRELHNGQVTESTTEPPRADGQPNTHVQQITRIKDLYVIIPYIKPSDKSFIKAGQNKQYRLKQQYPKAESWYREYTNIDDFKKIWTDLYNAVNAEKKKYNLCEVHLFGHSGQDSLYFLDNALHYSQVKNLEVLNWHKSKGAFVMHTCRSGRHEDNTNKQEKMKKISIAKEFSIYQDTKVIGQMTYANFTSIIRGFESAKNRGHTGVNFGIVDILKADKLVLWGYRSGERVRERYQDDPEYQLLADGQLWPSRGFIKGKALPRNVGREMYEEQDLNYI